MKRRSWWWIGLLAGLLILVGARAVYSQMPTSLPPGDDRLNGLPPGAGSACQGSPGQPTPVQVTVVVTGVPVPWPPPPACATPKPPWFQPTPSPPPESEYTIAGTVYDSDGTPLPGVQVYTESPSSYWTSAETDAEGRYTLQVHAGTYQLTAARQYPSPWPLTAPHRVVTVPPSREGVDLVLPPSYALGGTVRDHAGAPLTGAWVRAEPIGVNTATQGDGAYALELPAGNYCVSASLKGRNSAPAPQAVRLPPAQAGVDFFFLEDYLVGGVVYEVDGTPLEGAVVTASAEGLGSADAGTGADGRYSVRLITGTYSLDAWEVHHAYRAQASAGVPPDRPDADLTFGPAYSISGTVSDSVGDPLPGAVVGVCPFQGGGECGTDDTDAEGHYRVWVLQGQWQVRPFYPDLPSPPEQIVEVPPDQVVDFTFPPPRAAAAAMSETTISGTVRDGKGNPVPGAGLWAFADDCGGSGRACTSASGTYTITLDKAGSYVVWDGAEHRLVSVPPAASGVDFVQYAIQGTVRDESGQPVIAARMQADVGGEAVTTWTDRSGGYTLHVPAGTCQVTAEKGGYPPPSPQTVSAPPDASGVDFVLPTGHTISGLVLDGDGLPLPGAAVLAAGPAGSAETETDACGIYALLLPAGTYTVTVSLEGYTSPPAQTATVPPDAYALDWVMEPEPPPALYTISGTVRDSAAAPVEGAEVCAGKLCAFTDAEGGYQIEEPAGTYTVQAWKEGHGKPPEQTVTVPPDQAGIDFTLPLLYSVLGTVRDGGGQPLAAGVTAREPVCGSHAFTYWTKTGVYTLTLEAGTYEISAVAGTGSDGGYASTEFLSVTVPPAVQGVDLTIPLPVRYTLSGSVHDSSGNPLPGEVSAAACGQLGSVGKVIEGLYSLEVPAGTWLLSAEAAMGGYQGHQRTVVVSGDLPGIDWTLEPVAQPCCGVYGLAADEAGQPLAGVQVQVAEGPGDAQAQTANCGLYQLPLPAPGNYTLRASLTGYETVTQTVTVGTGATWVEWRLAARPTVAQLSGSVRDETDQPLAWAVWIHGLDEFYEDAAKTDEAGHYIFSLPAGRYRVETEQHPCYTDQPAQEVTVPPGATVDLAFEHRLTNRVSGRVASDLGLPIYGAVVSAVGSAGQACASSDTNGNYILRLAAGEWTLSVSQPPLCSYEPALDRWLAVPPDQAGVDFYLFKLAYLYLPLCTKAWP